MKIINLSQAVEILRSGGLVVVPTDTVYGIAADMANLDAVRRVYEIKGRSQEKPLIILVDSEEMVARYVNQISDEHRVLMGKFWPGALSLLFQVSDKIPREVNAGGEKIGVRMPAQQETLEIIKLLGRPIVATSVNKSGSPALKTIEAIAREFPDLPIVDGGDSVLGVESTVLNLVQKEGLETLEILREGAVSKEELEKFWN